LQERALELSDTVPIEPPVATRIPSLDGLRAVSILCVIIGHVCDTQSWAKTLATFGVEVFFVISGYLITSLLQEEQNRAGGINLVAFYRRRAFRILPAAMTYIAFTALVVPASRADLPYTLTYTVSYHLKPASGAIGHLWSLSVEEQFYLIWPVAMIIGYRNRSQIAIGAMIGAALFRIVCTISLGSNLLPLVVHYSFPATMDSIAAGCLFAIHSSRIRVHFRWLAEHGTFAAALATSVFGIAFLLWRDTFPNDRGATAAFRTAAWGVIPLLIALCIFILVERRDWVLNNPLVSGVGVLSYSLYLWQQPFTLGTGPLFVRLSLLCVFAILSYGLVESPMINLGRRLAQRQKAVTSLVA
jgi:peptidoglycan/LPS O-acetylase OafA/YrhL